MSDFVIEKIEEFARALLPSMGLELVEVQFRREGHGWVLRIFIDSEEGITVDHCADVSREVSDYLDVEDLIDHPYNLEVSSPGLERPLRSIADFERFAGRKARVKLREAVGDQKVFTGIIGQASDAGIELLLEDESTVQLPFELIRKARLSL
jgi:ribosome maturation factor RimP